MSFKVSDGYSVFTVPETSNARLVYNEVPPGPFMRAIEDDTYTKGTAKYSVTELLNPSRAVAISHTMGEDVRTPYSMMDSLLGRAVHAILEEYDPGEVTEEILYTTIEGSQLKGQFDRLLDDGVIEDYKTAKVSALKAKIYDDFKDWHLQLNCYASILREHGVDVTGLRIHCFLKDWSPLERDRQTDYPPFPWVEVNLTLLPDAEIRAWMLERIRAHEAAIAAPSLPLCTDEDRWGKPEMWAVMKQGRKTAVKLFASKQEALDWAYMQTDVAKLYLQNRPALSNRCRHYCPVAGKCDQWAALRASEEKGATDEPIDGGHTPSISTGIL